MARRSAKHDPQSITDITVRFGGGLNLAEAPTAIPDGQLLEALNVVYQDGEATPATRPGLLFGAAAVSGTPAITRLHYYVKSSTEAWLVGAFSDSTLRYYDSGAWTTIDTLSGTASTSPALRTYNSRLLVASGDPAGLSYWDGTTFAAIASSPKADALHEMAGRLVANSSDDLDGVYLCAPEDETKWLTVDGAAFFRAGYRDGLRVNGFGGIGSDLIVFKAGTDGNTVYRLNTAGASTGWSIEALSSGQTLSGPHAVEFVGNNLLFGTEFGIMDLSGVQEYGDLRVGSVGKPINPALNGKTVREIRHIPSRGYTLVFIVDDPNVYVYHPLLTAWTRLNFQNLRFYTACQTPDGVYLGGESGVLYLLSSSDGRDETADGVFEDYQMLIRTKLFAFPYDVVLRRSMVNFEVLTNSTGCLCILSRDLITSKSLLSWTAEAGQTSLFDWNEQLADATWKLGANTQDYLTSYSRARERSLAFQISTTTGRLKIREIIAQVAAVNG